MMKSRGESLEGSAFQKKESGCLSFGNRIGIFKERRGCLMLRTGSIRPQDPNIYFDAYTLYKQKRESER